MAHKRMILVLMLSLFALALFSQGTVVLAKRTATITADTSATNYVYTVVADTNWYVTGCSIDIPGYTINGVDTLDITQGGEGSTVLLRLKYGTDFEYSLRMPTGESYKSLASANNLDIVPGETAVYAITGTTTIRTIKTQYIPIGYTITMLFSTSLTVDDGSGTAALNYADIELNGSADFSATADDTLTLTYNGSKWVEKSRSVN